MEWLHFEQVCFLPNSSIGQLCEDLNEIIGQGTYYDTFEIQNTRWLWFIHNMITAINNDKAICGCFGLYPSFVGGILNSTKQIHFYVLCSEKLNHEYYINQCLATESSKLFTSANQGTFINYHLNVIRFLLCSKKEFFMNNCRPN